MDNATLVELAQIDETISELHVKRANILRQAARSSPPWLTLQEQSRLATQALPLGGLYGPFTSR